ncbi:MAG: chromosomal replication initiator protein DnaA [Clostridia bacterium]|nr:chromosomal replication initiator protein DnaA [Clostridia bacterium]
MDELSSISDILLSLIEQKMSSSLSIFNLWFNEFKLASLTDDKAVFTTPSAIKKNILSTKYQKLIAESLEEAIGFPLEISVLTDEEFKNPSPKSNNGTAPTIAPYFEAVKEPISNKDEDDEEEKIITESISSPSNKRTLLDDYTFENFVEGSSNKFAKAACYAVANEPNTYNPLFIYGNSGLGKTHLLYAVINHMKKNHPGINIVYKKCESFLEELIRAIRNGSTTAFKEKYRSCDVLLIDDIQFLAGKEQTQEEFFHTFSALYESDKQIILTSDRPPKEIKPLEDRLRTRFEGGLLADVQPPSFELRIAIIKQKADAMGLSVSNDLVEYMAERLQNNIRQIEGVLKRIYAVYSLTSAEVTKEKIDEVISIIDPGNIPTDALIEKILSSVSRAYGVPIDQMKSKKRTDTVANARHVAIYLIKQFTELTLKEIGAIFGRDYSTVISSVDKVEKNIKTVNNYEIEINRLIKEIKGQ